MRKVLIHAPSATRDNATGTKKNLTTLNNVAGRTNDCPGNWFPSADQLDYVDKQGSTLLKSA